MNSSTIVAILVGGGAILGGVELLEYPGGGLPSTSLGAILILGGLYLAVNAVLPVGE